MNIYLDGFLWVLGATLVAGVAAYLVRRVGTTEGVPENNEAAGQVFTIVGGLHAVLIAFVLISLFDSVGAAEDDAYTEADGLVAASWAADALGEPAASEVRDLALSYATRVSDFEWPLMQGGDGEVGDVGWAEIEQMRTAVTRAQVTEQWQNDQKSEAADKLWEVYKAREARLDSANSGINAVIWFALAAGSLMTISLPLLFGGPSPMTHVVIVSVLAGTMALLLFATYQLQNPYGGGADVGPDAFASAIARLR